MFGSLERFIGILIEHHAGKFPFWLAPDQVAVLPISSEQNDYAFKLKMLLEKKGLRSIIDNRNEKINYKIREHSVSKIPVLMICGAKEVQNQTITIRRFGLEQQQTMSLDEAMDKLSLESRTPSI
jgi:threonyl-tRNA synthetase